MVPFTLAIGTICLQTETGNTITSLFLYNLGILVCIYKLILLNRVECMK